MKEEDVEVIICSALLSFYFHAPYLTKDFVAKNTANANHPGFMEKRSFQIKVLPF